MLAASLNASAQKQKAKAEVAVPAFAASDSARLATQEAKLSVDSAITSQDSMNLAKLNTSLQPVQKKKRDWTTWKPEAKRAMWLALVLPGAGQIYNRKYWKLPIIYGGFVGCAYAITWNNQMYHDYSQAYLDIMDDDPNTQSYNQFLHLGATIDAYVDASLSEFDISDDLSLRVEPAVLNNGRSANPLRSGTLGVQCSLTF